MVKFIVTLVVETPKDRPPPTKTAVRDALHNFKPCPVEIYINGTGLSRYRVRSVDVN